MTNKINIRDLVLEALLEIVEKKHLSHFVLSMALKKYQYLEKQDRAFFMRLTEGCMERMITLDYVVEQFSKKVTIKKMKPVIRNILRMGVYQILYMDSVPDSAACNEAVKLAQKRGFSSLKPFVNGILRTVARQKDNIEYPEKTNDKALYYSITYSMPLWIVEQWFLQYGEELTEKMLSSSLQEKKTTIRCNLSKASKEEILKTLSKDMVTVERSPYLEYAFHISGYDYLERLEAFQKAYIQVQDVSSMMVAEACAPEKGNYIIDVCASPGGKSFHLADRLEGTGVIDARDISLFKIQRMEENKVQCGVSNVLIKEQDALILDPHSIEKADIVLADLPCSGLGVLKKKSDIKYNMTPERQEELVALQRQILSVVWQYVKPGGILIYSTCTVNQEENEKNVAWFLEHYPFKRESLLPFLPEALYQTDKKMLSDIEQGMVTLLPGVVKTDGFFLVRLKRV